MIKEPYYCNVRFFADSPSTTKIHWYPVNRDSPVLPYPSFVASPQWEDENGPAAGMYMGNPPSLQGVQFVQTMGGAPRVPRLEKRFTGEFCGTRPQWMGNLRSDRVADIGDINCCKNTFRFKAQSGSAASMDFGNITLVCLHATSGSVVSETDAAGVSEDFASCSCSAFEESHTPDRLEEFLSCSCAGVGVEFTGEGDTVGCSCSEMTFTATVTSETLDFNSCSCSEGDASSHSVEPGTDCSSAGELSVPFSITVPITGPATQWWKFPAPAGVQYYCKITSAIIGLTCDIRGFITDCDGTQFRVGIWSSNGCVSRTPSVDELCAPKITCPPLLSGTYTLEIGTGACP